ncbi:MAG: hypothetical protein KME15_14645 [Drouetiella hepatica Uher 2000/2452]|jgi:uncharacterized membrane protein|uniref:Uncharacterized protein n=1 Tax=Drouetiella hepatica Uher 2000/2452 TaxID=904376 RepID=A0A951QDJ7_9CYAN|nr:hypothetical protein [Drouetiella hepatica Uher 2000/2452]
MSARIEKFYPLLLGFLVGIASLYAAKIYGVSENFKDIFSAVINICGITIGFLATVITIILAFNDQHVIKQLKKTGSYKRIFNYFISSIQWFFTILLLSAIGLVLDFRTSSAWQPYFIGLWSFALAAAFLSYYRAIDIFTVILRSLD